jgi:hypothetical protein
MALLNRELPAFAALFLLTACATGQEKLAKGEVVSELGKSVMYVFRAKNGDYWFGSNDHGVYRYDGKATPRLTCSPCIRTTAATSGSGQTTAGRTGSTARRSRSGGRDAEGLAGARSGSWIVWETQDRAVWNILLRLAVYFSRRPRTRSGAGLAPLRLERRKARMDNLYPDLVAVGGLANALQAALSSLGSRLTVSGLDPDVKFVLYARVEYGDRFSQVYIGAEERTFIFDFWNRGVMLADAATPDLTEAAGAINLWVGSNCKTTELAAAFPFVEAGEKAAGFESGTEVESRWQDYLAGMGENFPELVEFTKAASARPELRQLFPFTSLNRFCFSRCTGYPYTTDTPYVWPQRDGSYNVYGRGEQLLGCGDAEAAVELVIQNLPPNCGPAVPGTEEDVPN